jgi:hypothetical protein
MGRDAAYQVLLAKAPALVRFADDAQEVDDNASLQSFISTALASSSAASAAHQLGEGVLALETALRQEVLARHTELVQQVTRCVWYGQPRASLCPTCLGACQRRG